MAIKGIDVAVWQGAIDWRRVKATGIDFAMIKATQGRAVSSNSYLFTDRQFVANITGASAAGLDVGVYHYLTAKTAREAQTEAAHFCETIAPYRDKITLWAAVDVEEDKYLPRDKTALTAIVDAFCAYVAAEGYKPIVYTNPNYIKYRLNDITKWSLWLALWRDKSRVPSGYGDMKLWQWGASAVDGINGNVDSNFGYFDTSIAEDKPTPPAVSPQFAAAAFKAGDRVKVRAGKNTLYGSNKRFTVWFRYYDVLSVKGDRVVIGKGKTVTAAVNASSLELYVL